MKKMLFPVPVFSEFAWIYTVSLKKTVQNCFRQNFVKFPPTIIIFGTQIAPIPCPPPAPLPSTPRQGQELYSVTPNANLHIQTGQNGLENYAD